MADWPPVQQRLPSLLPQPILFAHRGASAHAAENTIDAFALALRLGATGLESDVWATADGVAVLDHDGEVRAGWLRKRPIDTIARSQLPAHIPALADLIEQCGSDYHLSLDLKDRACGPLAIDTIAALAPELLERTWVCDHDTALLASLRHRSPDVKLVHSTRLARLTDSPERHAANLADVGIDAINLRRADWTGGLVTLFHRFGLIAFGWDMQHDYQLETAIRMGLDGVFSNHVDRMVDAARVEGVYE